MTDIVVGNEKSRLCVKFLHSLTDVMHAASVRLSPVCPVAGVSLHLPGSGGRKACRLPAPQTTQGQQGQLEKSVYMYLITIL